MYRCPCYELTRGKYLSVLCYRIVHSFCKVIENQACMVTFYGICSYVTVFHFWNVGSSSLLCALCPDIGGSIQRYPPIRRRSLAPAYAITLHMRMSRICLLKILLDLNFVYFDPVYYNFAMTATKHSVVIMCGCCKPLYTSPAVANIRAKILGISHAITRSCDKG